MSSVDLFCREPRREAPAEEKECVHPSAYGASVPGGAHHCHTFRDAFGRVLEFARHPHRHEGEG